MSWLRQFISRTRAFFQKGKWESDMAEEMRLHVEHLTQKGITGGLSPEEARFTAQRRFGGIDQIKEQCRDGLGWRLLDEFLRDLRFGARILRKNSGLAAVVILTLALCIGANTAIFSVVRTLVLKPLPFDEPGRLVELHNSTARSGFNKLPGSVVQFLEYKANSKSYENLALWDQVWRIYGDEDSLERMPGAFATAEIFQVLRVRPVAGTFFTADQNKPGADDVVVLTESFWESRFHRDPSIVGRKIWIDRQKVTVVGVVERAMEAFDARVNFIRAFSWTPDRKQPLARYAGFARLIGRLAPGVSLHQANAEAGAFEQRFAGTAPAPMRRFIEQAGLTMKVETVQAGRVGTIGPTLYLLQAAAAFVLLIGCVNVANLLLVRANTRQGEVSIRIALGAGRGVIVRQFLTEGILLTGLGSSLGIGLAWAALRVINRYTGELLPQALPVTIDGGVLSFALVLTGVVGLGIGLLPLSNVLRANLSGTLQLSARSASAGRGARSLTSILAIGQVAVALVLLVCAGLLILAFQRAISVDPGFDVSGVGQAVVNLPPAYRATDQAGQGLRDRVEQAMREIPGVTATTFSYSTPFHGGVGADALTLADDPRPSGSPLPGVFTIAVTPGYLATMRLRLIEGRFFEPRDAPLAQQHYVVDEAFARKYFPNKSAIGGRISFSGPPANGAAWPTIIGVVKNVPHNGVEDRTGNPFAYRFLQGHPAAFGLFFRTERPVSDALAAVRDKLRSIDPAIAVYNQASLESNIADSFDNRRAVTILLTAFAAVALFLASLGIYGVLAYDVAQRTREIGIRGSLGATRVQLVRMILGQGLWRIGIGLGTGLVAAVLLSRYMTSLLFEVRPTDPAVYAAVSVLLLFVASLASYLPARRAAKIDPIIALRTE